MSEKRTLLLLTQPYDVAPRGLLGYLGKRRFRGGREEIPSGQIVVGVRTGAVKPLEILAAEHNGQPTEATATMTMEADGEIGFLSFSKGYLGRSIGNHPSTTAMGLLVMSMGCLTDFVAETRLDWVYDTPNSVANPQNQEYLPIRAWMGGASSRGTICG